MKNLLYALHRRPLIYLVGLLSIIGCKNEDKGDDALPPEKDVRAEVRLVTHFALTGYKAVFAYSETKSATEPVAITVDPDRPNEGTCRLPLLSNHLVISSVSLTNDQPGSEPYIYDLPKGQRIDEKMKIEARNPGKDFFCTTGNLQSLLNNAKFSQAATEISIGGTLNEADFHSLKNYNKLQTITLIDQEDLPSNAFAMSTVKKVIVPNATRIGENCFDGAESLAEIVAPNLESIGGNAFRNTVVVEMDFPLLTRIAPSGLCEMALLRNVSFPGLQVLCQGVFGNCTNLNGVYLPAVTEIEAGVFYGCNSLQTLSFPEAARVGMMAFQECSSLRQLHLDKLETIPEQMCLRCDELQTVTAPSATVIGKLSFSECRLLSTIDFPNALFVGDHAFSKCSSLSSVSLPKVQESGSNGNQFYKCTALVSISMPVLLRIEKFAFSECTSLSQIDLPAAKVIEINAFGGCSSLEEIRLPAVELVSGGFNSMPALKRLDLPKADEFRADCFVESPLLCELKLGTEKTITIVGSGLVFEHIANSANCDLYLNGNNYSDAKLSQKTWNETKWKNIYQY